MFREKYICMLLLIRKYILYIVFLNNIINVILYIIVVNKFISYLNLLILWEDWVGKCLFIICRRYVV